MVNSILGNQTDLRLQMTEKVEMQPQKGFGTIVILIPSGRYLNIAKSALA